MDFKLTFIQVQTVEEAGRLLNLCAVLEVEGLRGFTTKFK
jgi:hypothetical protein